MALQRLGLHLGQRGPAIEEPLHRLPGVDVRHHAEHRDAEVGLDVLDGADRGIERLLHERQHQAHEQPQQGAHEHVFRASRPEGTSGLGGRSDDRDLLDALGLLDQRLLVLGLQQREQVVVDLGLALQALQLQLDGRDLPILLHDVAHLTVEELLAAAQQGDLRAHLAPHLRRGPRASGRRAPAAGGAGR